MPLVSLLVTLVIVGLICYLLYWLVGQIPMPEPFKVVAKVILALVVVVFLLDVLLGFGSLPRVRIG